MDREGIEALIVTFLPPAGMWDYLVYLAAGRRLPTIFANADSVRAGGLMSYGPSISALYRRAATYVDKILKGAKPEELPVEQPTKFDFVVNLRIAQALVLTIPESVLQQATEVIP